jgi:hypothetical protein
MRESYTGRLLVTQRHGTMRSMNIPASFVSKLIKRINNKNWWHVPPRDPNAYAKRGGFFASSFAEAEFWGRPLDESQRVTISRPLIGDEATIERKLFGQLVSNQEISMEERRALDAKMKKAALAKGYDSIVLMTPKAFSAFMAIGKLPRSMELNVLIDLPSKLP